MARPAASRKKKRDKAQKRALNASDSASSTVGALMTALSGASESAATAASALADTASTLATAGSTSAKCSAASTAPAPVPTRKPKGATGASTGQIDRPPPYKEGQSQRDNDKKMPAIADDLGHEGKGVDNGVDCDDCAKCLMKARIDALDMIRDWSDWNDRNDVEFHQVYLRRKNQARRFPDDGKLVESLKVLRKQMSYRKDFEKPPTPQRVEAKEEKMVNIITGVPVTDEEYDEIAARSVFLKSLVPVYSKDDMVRLVRHYGEVEGFRVIFDSGTKTGLQSVFFTMTSCEAANVALAGLKVMMSNGSTLWVGRPPPARDQRMLRIRVRDTSRANENVAVSSSTTLTGEQTIRERRAKEVTVAPQSVSAEDRSGAHKKRTPAITKWDLLQGLKCVTAESLQLDGTAGPEQLDEMYDFHVLNARNLSIGA